MKKQQTYENAVKELDEIGDKLESGELTLDESLTEFARGVELIKFCRETLSGARKRMTILLDGENGEKEEEPFDPGKYTDQV